MQSPICKARFHAGQPADLYFWRDNGGNEADIVFEREGRLQTVEIKSGATVTQDYIRAALKSARFAAGEAHMPWLLYGGDESYSRSGVEVMSCREVPRMLREAG